MMAKWFIVNLLYTRLQITSFCVSDPIDVFIYLFRNGNIGRSNKCLNASNRTTDDQAYLLLAVYRWEMLETLTVNVTLSFIGLRDE
jgi:hypothetical protein